MSYKGFLPALLILTVLAGAACNTGLLNGGRSEPVVAQATPTPAPLVVDGVRTSYADVVERTASAVVRIDAEHRNRPQARQQEPRSPLDEFFRQFPGPQGPQGQQRPPVERGMGSGVLVSADGTILTNAHVIDGAEKITVVLNDNKSYEAKLVGSDKPSDLAVLKIEAQNMPFLTLGNSDSVRVGDIVLAIGNPLGIGQTVTAGIISAKGRRTGLSDGSFEDFLQTDAPINRGNSGGALVNLNAELIGINSQILSTSGGNIGIAFSIPSNMAKSVMEQLLANGRVRRGRLGVNIQNITGDMAKALELPDSAGVIVSNVHQGSAADKAGVKVEDIITAINGEKIDDGNVLRNKIAGTLPGTTINLSILRDGSQQELSATLDEFDTETASADAPAGGDSDPKTEVPGGKLGLTLQPVTPQLSKQFGTGNETQGLVVMDVDQAGVAAEAGISRGDILLEINRQPATSVESVELAIRAGGSRPILLLVSRKGTTTFVTVRTS